MPTTDRICCPGCGCPQGDTHLPSCPELQRKRYESRAHWLKIWNEYRQLAIDVESYNDNNAEGVRFDAAQFIACAERVRGIIVALDAGDWSLMAQRVDEHLRLESEVQNADAP